jgi:hypothetical protein
VNGKIAAVAIVLSALIAGAGIWYLQEYAFYTPVNFTPGAEIVLTPITSDTPEPIVVKDVQGIDSDSSPLRYRACFTTQMSLATLTESYKVYEGATPLNAPSWFTCFDADKIGAAILSGEAVAFVGQKNVVPNRANVEIDRVVAVFPDGRAYAWNQLAPGTDTGTGVEE